jgi:hypothetical protein
VTDAAPFSPFELAAATTVALLVQIGFFLLLGTSGGTALRADLSDDNAKPMSVAITPMIDDAPLLKLGSPKQAKLPDRWAAPKAAEKPAPHPTPSPKANPDQMPAVVADAGVKSPSPVAEVAKETDVPAPPDTSPGPAASVAGAADGVKEGTETDPLKARQIDLYKQRIDRWFTMHFNVRGKLAFDTLKTLSAGVVVTIAPDRTVASFAITRPSGNEVFDGELRSSLNSIRANGLELPPPPEAYPDILGQTLSLNFMCKVRSECE